MRVTRIFVPEPLANLDEIQLGGKAARHLTRALRLRPGAEVTLFDGLGGEHRARIVDCDRSTARLEMVEFRNTERESPIHTTLCQSVTRGDRMDYTIQKATELGVSRLIPVFTRRGVVRLDAERGVRRLEHWRSIATSACEQCGRNRVPAIEEPLDLDALPDVLSDGVRLFLDPEAAAPIGTHTDMGTNIVWFVGPEGGLDDDEKNCLQAAGFKNVSLGPRVLRTETAGVAALAATQALWGDWR